MGKRLISFDDSDDDFPDEINAALDRRYKSALLVTPAMSQASIQAALNALNTGDAVRFKGAGGAYGLTSPLTLPADGILVDAEDATFSQTVWGQPAFDLIGRNWMTLDLGTVEYDGASRGGMGSSYRGSSQYVSGCGVWMNGDHNEVRKLRTIAMPVGVFLSSWGGTSTYDRVGVGNRLGVIEVEGANFGVLYVGQNGLVVDDIYGRDDIDDSAGANPTHVIYGSATTSFRATGGHFKSVHGKNILNGQPLQVKYHDSLTVDVLRGEDSKGLLNVIDSDDLTVSSYRGLGLLANAGQGVISLQSTNTKSQRPRFGKGYVEHVAGVDERVVSIIADDGDFDSLSVQSNHTGGVNVNAVGADVIVRGSRNTFRNTKVRQLGGAVPAFSVGFGAAPAGTASGTLIKHPEISGALLGVKMSPGAASLGVVVEYDPAMQSITGSAFFDTNGGLESVATSTAPPSTLSTLGESAVLALIAGAGTPTVGAANSALQVRVTPRRNITVTSLTWWSATASGNYDIGIVDDATNAVLWSKGSTAWPAAGKIVEVVPNTKLVAGRTYRLVFSADNVTGMLRGNQAPISGLDQRLDGSTAATVVSAAFPIPTPTLAAGGSGSTTRTPLIVVGGS